MKKVNFVNNVIRGAMMVVGICAAASAVLDLINEKNFCERFKNVIKYNVHKITR